MSYVPPNRRNSGRDNNSSTSKDSNRFNREDSSPRTQDNRGQDNRGQDNRRDNRDNRYETSNTQRWAGPSNDIRQNKSRFKKTQGGRAHAELSTEPNPDLEEELFGIANASCVQQGINFAEYDKIPVEVSGKEPPVAIETFGELLSSQRLIENIKLCKFQSPTPIQKYSIPTVIAKRDLMACAQTGSGKTAAFLIPCIETLTRVNTDDHHIRSQRKFHPRALILAPTRELAQQIHEQARKLMYCTGMRPVCIYGGSKIQSQQSDLRQGVDVLIATPGRLWDMIERGWMSLAKVCFFILDEADRMLDMGFEPQIRQIVDKADMPGAPMRRTLMYSATFPDEIQGLAGDFLTEYIFLAVGRVGSTTNLITQKLRLVENYNKMDALMDVLNYIEDHNGGQTLIFTATKAQANQIEYTLNALDVGSITIHGDKNQDERNFALKEFREARRAILVATDVAARGLDIPNVLWVVQYDLPQNIEDYVHRIGRTGRRGNSGTAISFVNSKNKNVFKGLLTLLHENGQDVPSWFANMCKQFGRNDNNFRPMGGPKKSRGKKVQKDVRRARVMADPEPSSKKVRKKKKKTNYDDAW